MLRFAPSRTARTGTARFRALIHSRVTATVGELTSTVSGQGTPARAAGTTLQRAHRIVALICAAIEREVELSALPLDADEATAQADLLSRAGYADGGMPTQDVRAAMAVMAHAKGLVIPRALPAWQGLRRLLADSARFSRVITRGGAAIALALVLIVSLAVVRRGHDFAAWTATVGPVAAEATDIEQNLNLVATSAGSVAAFPAGSFAHAQASLRDISAAQSALSGLFASSADPILLHDVAAGHPDAGAVVAHDGPLVASARQHLQAARSELTLAHEVKAYGQKWSTLATPPTMPSDLAVAWASAAAQMSSALAAGDVTALSRADKHLDLLIKGGEQETTVADQVRALPGVAASQAASLLAPLNGMIAAGDQEGALTLLARWDALRAQVPVSYEFRLLNGAGQHPGAVRQLAGTSAPKRYYLLVKVVDSTTGAPVGLPVIDAESGAATTAQLVGLEVSAEVFAAVQADLPNLPANVAIGGKVAGDLLPTFGVTVLPGRITHW